MKAIQIGLVILYGSLDGWPVPDHDSGSRRGATAALLGMLSDSTIRPSIQERVPLAEAARAQALLESGGVLGQLVLKPGAPAPSGARARPRTRA